MTNREIIAAPKAAEALTIRGVGSSNSATSEDIIVTNRAITLQYPNTDAANIVGISYTLAMKLMVKAEEIPNFAKIMNRKITFVLSMKYSRSKEPVIEMVYDNANPFLGPSAL